MKILCISGSNRENSSNIKLILAIPYLLPKVNFEHYTELHELPIFTAKIDQHPWPVEVLSWRKALAEADALIICTPEYIYNVPAIIKNALEWVTSSGELFHKPVLPITMTPHSPRGEKAMQSLLWSLQALDARIVSQLPLYQNEVAFDKNGQLLEGDSREMLIAAIELLSNNH